MAEGDKTPEEIAAEEAAAAEETAKAAAKAAKKAEKKDDGKPEGKSDLVTTFLGLSGYKKEDVIGHHDGRRTVVTSNGGKYEVSKKGKRVRVLSGPETPASLEAAAEEDDE